jgi:hypothetical protein
MKEEVDKENAHPNMPRSNSRMMAFVYISSSTVHFPFRKGTTGEDFMGASLINVRFCEAYL